MTAESAKRYATTDGKPADEAYQAQYGGHAPAPKPIDSATGQHGAYWVLSEEERSKGFVRPVRRKYLHVGERPKGELRDLTDEERTLFGDCGYVKFEVYPPSQFPSTGRFWTAAQLASGCGSETTMAQSIAETYARDPKFYGATFCCACRKHFPVAQFVWCDAAGERVGS